MTKCWIFGYANINEYKLTSRAKSPPVYTNQFDVVDIVKSLNNKYKNNKECNIFDNFNIEKLMELDFGVHWIYKDDEKAHWLSVCELQKL